MLPIMFPTARHKGRRRIPLFRHIWRADFVGETFPTVLEPQILIFPAERVSGRVSVSESRPVFTATVEQ
jgi:hypothetical protein